MAHIVSCMLEADGDEFTLSLNNYIAKATSPPPANIDMSLDRAPTPVAEKPGFAWRMHQPIERKYQLFPKERQLPPVPGKSLDPEQAFAHAMGQNGDKPEKTPAGSGLRIRIKEHNLIRRRKVSVPDLGPMTTVQEAAMDSPTIPGRPPLHERSISAPGNSWRQHHLAEVTAFSAAQIPDEKAEMEVVQENSLTGLPRPKTEKALPLSPRSLAPLVIPTVTFPAPRLTRQISHTKLRSGGTPFEPPTRPAQCDDSPKSRTPFTPLSASTTLTTPRSAALSTMTTSTLSTPISAPMEIRSSPKPWERPSNYVLAGTPEDMGEMLFSTPKTDRVPRNPSALGHRRNQSESGGIMERGRPRRRGEINDSTPTKRTASKRSKSVERRAFEQLPEGWKADDAVSALGLQEATALRKQALEQAARFEVLKKDDVDQLSRELRHLDERCEYLRRTYTSLRAGRRNLHARICTYLRSPRTAKFSHDSMLKQEEALAELDASIDDWVTKLEQAENRRTRVRQKLLEHVAAAATLPLGVVGVSESLQLAMGVRSSQPPSAGNISTPPRSPIKGFFVGQHTLSSSPSPQRIVAHVPSTILEQPLFEEDMPATIGLGLDKDAASIRRAETICIYADNDVYTLLADVESQITKMSSGVDALYDREPMPSLSDDERRKLHRAQSQELLSGLSPLKRAVTLDSTIAAKTEPVDGDIFLTSAVFCP